MLRKYRCHPAEASARSKFSLSSRIAKKPSVRLTMFCQNLRMLHHSGMKLLLSLFAVCSLSMFLTNCSTTGGGGSGGSQQAGIGPFDSQGRYREEWADNPSQWRKPGNSAPSVSKSENLPQVAKNEQPPMNSVPLTSSTPQPKPSIASTKTTTQAKPESQAVVVKTRPIKKTDSEPEVVKVKPKTKPEPEREVVRTKSKSNTTAKSKPKSSRYVVKQGDSLSAIASRNGCSVSALQRENGISGAMIHPGQSLTIPR